MASGGGEIRMVFLIPKQCFWMWKLVSKQALCLKSLGGGGEEHRLWMAFSELCDVSILDGPIFDQSDFKKYLELL